MHVLDGVNYFRSLPLDRLLCGAAWSPLSPSSGGRALSCKIDAGADIKIKRLLGMLLDRRRKEGMSKRKVNPCEFPVRSGVVTPHLPGDRRGFLAFRFVGKRELALSLLHRPC